MMPLRSPFRSTLFCAKLEDFAVDGQAVEELGAAAVLAEHEAAARAHRDVVGRVQHLRTLGDSNTRRASRWGLVLPDLALSHVAAAGRHEVDLAATVPGALEPAEGGAALSEALREHSSRRSARDPDRGCRSSPRDVSGSSWIWFEAGVVLRLAVDRQHLQRAAGGELAALIRQEPIEAGVVPGVLGLVDDAGADRVAMASWRKRPIALSGSGVVAAERRDFVDVAVRLRERVAGRRVERLFAREPRPPRRRPAGAVGHRSGDAGPGLDELALPRVELQRGRAAAGGRVVRQGRREGAALEPIS